MARNRRTFTDPGWFRWPWTADPDFDELQGWIYDELVDRALSYFTAGVLSGCAVTESSPTAMSVDVSAGRGIHGDGLLANLASAVTRTIAAADPTNPRIDLVVLQVTEATGASDTNPNTSVVFDKEVIETTDIVIVTGTPSATPNPPAKPADSIVLAEVTVGAGVTEILDADIDQTIMQSGGPRELAAVQGTGQVTIAATGLKVGTYAYQSDSIVSLKRGLAGRIAIEIDGTVVVKTDADLLFNLTTDLDVGGETADTWYYAYVENVAGVLVPHISATAPNVTSGKIGYHPTNQGWRYVGAFRNDAASDIRPFETLPDGSIFWRTTEIVAGGLTDAQTYAALSLAAQVPPTARLARIHAMINQEGVQTGSTITYYAPAALVGQNGPGNVCVQLPQDIDSTQTDEGPQAMTFDMPVDASGEIAVAVDSQNDLEVHELRVVSWRDVV